MSEEIMVDVPEEIPCDCVYRCGHDSMGGIRAGDMLYVKLGAVEGRALVVVETEAGNALGEFYQTDGLSVLHLDSGEAYVFNEDHPMEHIRIMGRVTGFTHVFGEGKPCPQES